MDILAQMIAAREQKIRDAQAQINDLIQQPDTCIADREHMFAAVRQLQAQIHDARIVLDALREAREALARETSVSIPALALVG